MGFSGMYALAEVYQELAMYTYRSLSFTHYRQIGLYRDNTNGVREQHDEIRCVVFSG